METTSLASQIKEEATIIKQESLDVDFETEDEEYSPNNEDNDDDLDYQPSKKVSKFTRSSACSVKYFKKPILQGDFVPIPASDKTRLAREFNYNGERDESLQFPCQQCMWGTDNINYFKEHQLRHKYSTEENNLFYFCRLCEAGYKEWSSLYKHR